MTMNKILTCLTIVVAIIFLAIVGIRKQETKECIEWQGYAKEYPRFYLTSWQIAQCEARGIPQK